VKTFNKLSIIGGAFLASLTCSLVAQTPAPESSPASADKCDKCGPNAPRDPLAKLNLTDDQKNQVQTVMQKTREDVKTIKENAALTPEQKGQQIQAARQSSDEQMKTILTPEQYQKFEEMKAAWKNKGEGKDRPHNPFEKLNLTEEQKAQIHPIMQKTGEEIQAVKADTALTKEQKEQQIQTIKESTDEQLKTILTSEQYQKLEQMKAEHKGKHHENGDKPDAPANN